MQQRLGRRVFLERSGLAAAGIPLPRSAGFLAACRGADSRSSDGSSTGITSFISRIANIAELEQG